MGGENLLKVFEDKSTHRLTMLMYGFIHGVLTEREHDELDEWVSKSDDHILLFEELIERYRNPSPSNSEGD